MHSCYMGKYKGTHTKSFLCITLGAVLLASKQTPPTSPGIQHLPQEFGTDSRDFYMRLLILWYPTGWVLLSFPFHTGENGS